MENVPDASPRVKAVGDSDARDLDAKILEFIKAREHVSFPELQAFCDSIGVPGRGNWSATLGGFDHVVLWPDLSDPLFWSFKRLLEGRRVFLHPASIYIYQADGFLCTLPLVTGSYPYQTDHWLPAVVCTYPYRIEQPAAEGAAHG